MLTRLQVAKMFAQARWFFETYMPPTGGSGGGGKCKEGIVDQVSEIIDETR